MKNTLLLTFLLISLNPLNGQKALIDRSGVSSFFSEAPMENILAVNKEVIGAIDLNSGTLAVTMMIKKFHFEKSLMEEHFNENYMESERFPKATFKGSINNFSQLDFTKNGTLEAEVSGEIQIHGVKKQFKALVTFNVSSSKIQATTAFKISLADFDVEIPKLLFKNIAEVVDVKQSFNFSR